MYTKLSPQERLKDLRVVDKHLTLEQLEAQTGLSKAALGNYERKEQDISAFAIATLAKFYGVSTDYLMGLTENKNHPNAELQALHLSDDMVALLSSGKINNRLLCELATHPNFLRLMVDMEIFIDRIADMRVNQMNLILEATRQTILKEHAPGENDLYMRTLELGQVQENDFYSHILHDDLDSIVRDIREAHLKDKTTADPQPTLDEVKENFEQAIQMGTDTEAMIHEFCDKMQIPFEKISSANCKCKLDTCTVELSESERRSGWKPLASVLGDAAAAFGCVNRVEELVKQLLRGAVAKLLARPSVQFISCSQDILSRESLNGHALRNEGSKQPVVTFVLGTFPRGVGMRKVDCTAPVLDLTERRELRAVVHGNGLEDL